MNIANFERKRYIPFEEELKIEVHRRCNLAKKLKKMPNEIQKKIYIETIRKYWKELTLNTPLRPMWYDSKSYMDNQIRDSLFNNIHFMHLECNTLEKNKEWIPGCQCSFCLNDTKVEDKESIYQEIYDNGPPYQSTQLEKRTHCYDFFPNFWNMYSLLMGINLNIDEPQVSMIVFDPLKNQFGDEFSKVYEDPNESPIYFSEELISQYS
jgi:hypothetical protein